MTGKSAEIKKELDKLISESVALLDKSHTDHKPGVATSGHIIALQYQTWYSKALPVIRQLLPERYAEFQEQYKVEKRKELTYLTYAISDYLVGITIASIDPWTAFFTRFHHQITILESATSRLDSILADIRAVLQAELFDDEISAAMELFKKNHLRAAGAVTGVVLEEHLKQVAQRHEIKIPKGEPTLAELNDALKAAAIYDVPVWRFVQRLADIRNLCVHAKDREPSKDEVEELIGGADKTIKTIG